MHLDSFVIKLIDQTGIVVVRDRKLATYGIYKIQGLTKLTLKNLALVLRRSGVSYTTSKSKLYGDVFKFDFGNKTYAINCKTKQITVFFKKGYYPQ